MKQAFNPFLPEWEYIPDGEPHVFGDRVYLFGSHDQEAGETFCMLDYVVWSAPVKELGDWTCSGVIYSAKQDPRYDPDKRQYLYAPDVVQGCDGRFYLYYCLSGPGGRGGYHNPISVAVCDMPDGRYQFYGVVSAPDGKPLMRYVCFDPAVINDGGTIRLTYGTDNPWLNRIPFRCQREKLLQDIYGRTPEEMAAVPEGITGAYTVVLREDMLTVAHTPVRIDTAISGEGYEKHRFFEGSSLRKIGQTYYFIYSSLQNHELCYATSREPDRDFRFGGTLISNGDVGYQGRSPRNRLNHTGTNHGSIVCLAGQWYVFYHRLTNQSDYSRQACAEKITIAPDGSIPQVEMTSCGLNPGPLAGNGEYPAVLCCNLTNGRMRHGSNGNRAYRAPAVTSRNGERFVGGIGNGTLVGYKYFRLGSRVTLDLRFRGSARGVLEVRTAPEGPAVAQVPVTPGDDWQTLCAQWRQPAGDYPLYLYFRGRGTGELLSLTVTSRE